MPISLAAAWQFLGIRGAIAVGLGLALALSMLRADAISGQRDDALREVGRLEATIDQIEAAQEQARIAARNQRLEAEARYQRLAEEADAQVEQARIDAMDAAERYIARNRVPRPAPDRSDYGSAGAIANGGSPEGGDGPGEASVMDGAVAVEAEDVRICTEAVLRLEAVRVWAVEMSE